MKKNNELNELIYEYYQSRILFGVYKYGEQLKSIPQICASFRVARNTVQIALNRLEENRYIKTEKGKVARVIYQGTEELFRENVIKYFALRRDGILDIQFYGNLTFSSIWERGLQNFRLEMSNNTDGPNVAGKNSSEPIRMYVDVLDTFHNGLLLGLFWQHMRYINYFYPPKNDRKANYTAEDLLSLEKANRLKQETDSYYLNIYLNIMKFIEANREKYHLDYETQIPFTWVISVSYTHLRAHET